MRLAPIDYAVVAFYFAVVVGIGWALKHRVQGSADFLTARHSIPAAIAGLHSFRPTWAPRK